MQVGQFPSIHLSSNWRSLQYMHSSSGIITNTHIHTFFGTVLRREKTGTSHRYVLNAVITWAPEWGQTCCIKFILVTFFSGHRFQENQPVYPASIISVLGEEPILRLSTNVQAFPLTKNNCETKPHGRQELNNKNIKQTKLANNSHNIHEKGRHWKLHISLP